MPKKIYGAVTLAAIGVYSVNQVWNVFTKERTQTQIFTEALLWAGVWIVFDKIFGICFN